MKMKNIIVLVSATVFATSNGEDVKSKPSEFQVHRSEPSIRICCRAMTASCLACSEGITISEYCTKNPTTVGCDQLETQNNSNNSDSNRNKSEHSESGPTGSVNKKIEAGISSDVTEISNTSTGVELVEMRELSEQSKYCEVDAHCPPQLPQCTGTEPDGKPKPGNDGNMCCENRAPSTSFSSSTGSYSCKAGGGGGFSAATDWESYFQYDPNAVLVKRDCK